ncbi:MAG: AI-2E family transporter [Patescibacteria group bacterium]|mgnify:CR=1 FL=1|jgi:predicted PurR-regulated permease PerM|nr:AI-2E family transporter [Patescibacteria group bacterium]
MKDKAFAKYFLIFLVIVASVAVILLFRPFLVEIIIAAVLTSVFYSPFLKLSRFLGGRKKIAAFLMCLSLLIVVILPVSGIIVFFSKKAPVAYSETLNFLDAIDKNQGDLMDRIGFFNSDNFDFKTFILKTTKGLSEYLTKGAAVIIKKTTAFLFSLALIFLAMFFFFIDGERMLEKLKLWSPLPNKYDLEIFKKFRETSYASMISTFLVAGVQGLVGALGFVIVGVPAFYPGLFIAMFSLIPYIGSMIIYIPIGLFLIASGQVFTGAFIIAWGAIVIGNIDNLLRAWILHGHNKINPIFIIFALSGGVVLFGFWGLVLGPLILSLVMTVFHIYELEYEKVLEK